MKKNNFFIKRLNKTGNHSRQVLIPSNFLKELKIDDSSFLILELDEENQQVKIRKINEDELLEKKGFEKE